MARILILAKNPREAGSFAALMGWRVGQYRAVQKSGSIKGVRNAEVFLLPSFLERRDRHSVMAALRYARAVVYYVDPADLTDPIELPPGFVEQAQQADDLGELTDRQLEVAHRYNGLRDADDMVSEGGPVTAEPEKPKPKPRATRKTSATPDNFFE